MKINSLYIHAFGGLKNFSLTLGDGLTVIYGDNEMGKSTVMAFIKMMFYGSGRAGGQLAKNIRQKYTPWDNTQMAGSIDFEHGGKRYRLEKEFRTSNSTDKATLCDLDLGTRQAAPGDVGASFFGLSLAAFERSVFIGQLGFPEKDTAAEGEINSKLSNIALTGEESVSFDAVNKRLEKVKLSLMSKSGRAGEYDKNMKLLAETEDRIKKSEEKLSAVAGKKAAAKALENEATILSKRALELKEKISTEQDVRNAEKLSELLELKKQLDAYNEGLKLDDGSIIDEIYLRKLKFCISKLDAAEEKCTAKKSEIELLNKSIKAGLNPPEDASEEKAAELKKEIAENEAKRQKNENAAEKLKSELLECEKSAKIRSGTLGFVALAAGFLCVAVAIILSILKFNIPFIILGIIGILLIAFCPIYLILIKGAKAKILKTGEEIKSRLSALETENLGLTKISFEKTARLEAINAALLSSTAVIEKQQQLLNECEKELILLTEEKEAEEKPLLELFSKYRKAQTATEIKDCLEELTEKTEKQKELKQQLNFILKDLNGISYEEAAQKLEAIKNSNLSLSENFDALKEEYELSLSRISELKAQIAALSAEIKSVLSGMENTETLKKEVLALKEKTDLQREFCEQIDLASAVLAESFAEVRRSYGSVLEKKAGGLFESITGGKYNDMSISKSLDINVAEKGKFGSREIDYLSSGTADQAYLSLRLALTELMCKDGESLPLFLDDALTQYDDNRVKTALGFLKEYAQNTQLIMFTCHSFICETAKELEIKVKKLGE